MSNTRPILATLLTVTAACGGDNKATTPDASPPLVDAPPMVQSACEKLGLTPAALRTDLAWYGNNRADLTAWMDAGGCASPTFDPAQRPVATFDWDNTITKNDFGDAITYYFIKQGKVLQPPSHDWHNVNPYLTTAAVTALSAACGTTIPDGQSLQTDTNTNCADEIISIYDNEVTRGGLAAFGGANLRRIEPAYELTPQLMAGYTHAEVAQMTLDAVTPMLAAVQGAVQTVGTNTGENGWLRFYDQQKDLIAALESRGFDVWIITASPQDVVGAVSPMVGIPADHVIGIRSLVDTAGKLTYQFEGCGPVADGTAIMPYIQGKRCYINKVVYGDTTATAIQRRPDGKRQFLSVADTDSDVEFLRDAKYKLVINRNKSDMMCHAYYNEGDSWRVNPMFIGPKPAHAVYPCSTTAFTTESGGSAPSRDEGGNIIPDQADLVHP